MSILKSKAPTTPTLDERHYAASATASAALSVFTSLEADLRYAAEEHDEVAAEAQRKIDGLLVLRTQAQDARNDALAQAERVAALTA